MQGIIPCFSVFPLNTPLVASDRLYFHFHSIKIPLILVISILVCSLSYGLFRRLLFIQVFGIFPELFLLLISNLVPLWSENMLCMTRIVFNVSILIFCLESVVRPGTWSVCTRKECVFCCCWVKFSINVS